MNHTNPRRRQALLTTWRALTAIRDDTRLTPEDRAAIDRVFDIIIVHWLKRRPEQQDLHP